MSNVKLIAVGIRKEKNGQQILETRESSERETCKQCGKNARQNGSSRCGDCSKKKVTQSLNEQRLERKIKEAVNN